MHAMHISITLERNRSLTTFKINGIVIKQKSIRILRIATLKEGMIFDGVWMRPSDKDKGQIVGSTNTLAKC